MKYDVHAIITSTHGGTVMLWMLDSMYPTHAVLIRICFQLYNCFEENIMFCCYWNLLQKMTENRVIEKTYLGFLKALNKWQFSWIYLLTIITSNQSFDKRIQRRISNKWVKKRSLNTNKVKHTEWLQHTT